MKKNENHACRLYLANQEKTCENCRFYQQTPLFSRCLLKGFKISPDNSCLDFVFSDEVIRKMNAYFEDLHKEKPTFKQTTLF